MASNSKPCAAASAAAAKKQRIETTTDKASQQQQNTMGWLAKRRGKSGTRLGASDAAAATGWSRTAWPRSLYDVLVANAAKTMDERMVELRADAEARASGEDSSAQFTEHGHRCESSIVRLYEALTGNQVRPGGYSRSPTHPKLFGASPDGRVVLRGGTVASGLLECKAPCFVVPLVVSDEHMLQMQVQMHVTGARWCDYVACALDRSRRPEEHVDELIESIKQARLKGDADIDSLHLPVFMRRVRYSRRLCDEWLMPRLLYFCDCVERRQPPDDVKKYPCAVFTEALRDRADHYKTKDSLARALGVVAEQIDLPPSL